MTKQQRGYADNYAGVPRHANSSHEWLMGWDEAQNHRLQDEREIRKATSDFQNHCASLDPTQRCNSGYAE